jgi:hypothetical protein
VEEISLSIDWRENSLGSPFSWSIDLHHTQLSYANISHLRQFALRDRIVVGTASSTTAVLAIVISYMSISS